MLRYNDSESRSKNLMRKRVFLAREGVGLGRGRCYGGRINKNKEILMLGQRKKKV